jgi:hypothetical protein
MKSECNFANNCKGTSIIEWRWPPDRLSTPLAGLLPTHTHLSVTKMRYITKWVNSIGYRNRVKYVYVLLGHVFAHAQFTEHLLCFTFSHNRCWSEERLYLYAISACPAHLFAELCQCKLTATNLLRGHRYNSPITEGC